MSGVTYSRFPAAVSSPSRRERKAALVVVDGVARIAVRTRDGVQVVEEFAVVEVLTGARRLVTLVAEDGTEWTIDKGDGCSCASPLRTWYNQQLGTPKRSGRG